MATDRQLAANRQNAQKSTGPRTAHGKATSSRNNTRHGLRATTPVIPRLESPAAWEQHYTNTVYSLAPVNPLEEALAERVALILWRLDRVARYERDVTSQSQDRAPADLTTTEDDEDESDADDRDLVAVRQRYNEARRRARVLTSLYDRPADAHLTGKDAASALDAIGEQISGFDVNAFCAPEIVPDHLEYDDVRDWTVDRLLRYIAAIASANDRDPDDLRAHALIAARRQHNAERITCRRLTRQLRDLRRERILPQAPNLAQVVRYEHHLMRQLTQTLGHLKQLQQQRQASRPRASHLPLSAPAGAQGLRPPGGEDLDFDRSNPIESPIPPGQPDHAAGAAPVCTTPALVCATPAPDCAPPDPDCTRPDHRSLDNHWGEGQHPPAL